MVRLLFLGLCLLPSLGFAQEPVISRYREAELGNAEAQVEVGHYYVIQYARNRIRRNLTEALDWYGRAAKQRNTLGMMRLAELHLRPEPEVHSPADAFDWYDRLYESNRPETGCNAALARFYAEGVPARDGKPASPPDLRRAYYHALLHASTGIMPPDLTEIKSRARGKLTAAEVKDVEDRAFRWVEDHNKPGFKLEVELAAGEGPDKAGKKNKDGKATTTDEPIDTSDKALDLAIKNQQESAKQVAPLGKQKRYLLPSADREKK
ncbi:hypothetical protein LBMAG55_17540 [Verrucomicrobiota bacterium]|nr:hypothetical protein LBMAG55_17540 [Verrucomicrobiota bacterium]